MITELLNTDHRLASGTICRHTSSWLDLSTETAVETILIDMMLTVRQIQMQQGIVATFKSPPKKKLQFKVERWGGRRGKGRGRGMGRRVHLDVHGTM